MHQCLDSKVQDGRIETERRRRCAKAKADYHEPTSNEKLAHDVCRLYFRNGLSMRETGERLGFKSARAIQRVFREQGWKPRPAGPTRGSVNPDKVHRLYFIEARTIRQVAAILDVSKDVIVKTFKAQGWQTRREAASKHEIDPSEVDRLYFKQGLTKMETAEKLGVSEWGLRRVFREMGWSSIVRQFKSDEDRAQALRERRQKIKDRVRGLREKLFGTECRICGKDTSLAIHRKDGTKHEKNRLWSLGYLKALEPDDWAALCRPCHQGVHFMMEHAESGYGKVESFAKTGKHRSDNILRPLDLPSVDASSSRRYIELKREHESDSKKLRFALFGETCHFCGIHHEDTRVVIHRKDGRLHPNELTKTERYFRTLEPEEWVSLCQKHHLSVHWAMEILGFKWKNIDCASKRYPTQDSSSPRHHS